MLLAGAGGVGVVTVVGDDCTVCGVGLDEPPPPQAASNKLLMVAIARCLMFRLFMAVSLKKWFMRFNRGGSHCSSSNNDAIKTLVKKYNPLLQNKGLFEITIHGRK
ncbi:hypothetical protein ACFS07_00910 [Undibacterium arcticum]